MSLQLLIRRHQLCEGLLRVDVCHPKPTGEFTVSGTLESSDPKPVTLCSTAVHALRLKNYKEKTASRQII